METPLLTTSNGDYRPAKGVGEWWAIFCIETAKLWRIGGLIAFTIICQFGLDSVTAIFVGHIGNIELSSISIAQTIISIFALGFMNGMGSALKTLCGQAFGAGQVHMLGVYAQRSMIVLILSAFVLLPIYVFATPILKLLGQEHDIAVLAGRFVMLTIPQLYSLCISIPASNFLLAQSKVGVLAWIGFMVLIVYALLLRLFIYVFNWGLTGVAIAFDLVGWINALGQLAYIVVWCKDGWKGWCWSAFNEIWAFVRLSIESAGMICLENWYTMCIVLLTGHLKHAVTAVGSLSICMNVSGWEAMFFVGVNIAISVRVSNELGLGHSRATKYSVYATVFQSLVIGIVCVVIVLAARNHLAILFTNSKDLQHAVADLAWLLAIAMLLNSVQPVLSGVAIGAGWQGLVACINLGSYYAFGIPLGYILGYVLNLGVAGIWGGMVAGFALQTLLISFVIYRIDWNKEVEQMAERMRKWGGQDFEIEKTTIAPA